jgi:hypothetical protein
MTEQAPAAAPTGSRAAAGLPASTWALSTSMPR